MVCAWLGNQSASSAAMRRTQSNSPWVPRRALSRITSSTTACWVLWQLPGAKPVARIQASSWPK